MSWSGFLAVGLGGAIGCWMRWILGILLNPIFPTLPLGTLAANLTGGLTTFSTFSAEANTLLLRGQLMWFGTHVVVHLVGSLAMTILGIFLTRTLLHH